jgi:hypothetical protein
LLVTVTEIEDERWARRVFVATGTLASVFYLIIGRRLWFVNDEWDFLAGRTIGSARGLFSSHNGHWSTLPVIAYRAFWWAFGIRSYTPYQVMIVALHLLAAWLLRKVMIRAGVAPWTATATALVLVLFGRGAPEIIWPFQITYVGALVLGLTHLLLADHDGPLDRRDWLGLAAGAAGLLCSGIAITMVIVVGIATLLRRGVRIAAVHTVPLALMYLAWLSTASQDTFTSDNSTFSEKARFVLTTPLNALRAMSSFRGGQVLLSMLLVVGLVIAWRRCTWAQWSARYSAPAALLIGSEVFIVITALGRAGSGASAFRNRYLDVALAMMLPALAIAADAVMRRRRALMLPVFVLLLIGIPSNIHAIDTYTTSQQKSTAVYRHTVLALPRQPLSRRVPRSVRPLAGITIGWLLDGVDSGRIPAPGPVGPVEAATDKLRLSLLQRPASGAGITTGCRSVTAALTIHLLPTQSIRVAQGAIRVAPATGPFEGTYPAIFHRGAALTPVASALTFRVLPAEAREPVRLCGPS